MIVISEKTINATLEEIANNAHNMLEFSKRKMEDLKNEQPVLEAYLKGGLENLNRSENTLVIAGYLSGSGITYRIIKAQLKINGMSFPRISGANCLYTSEDMYNFLEMEVSNVAKAKLSQINRDNPYFGDYVHTYINNPSTNRSVAEGFLIGVVSVYSVCEQAFKQKL